MENNLEERLLKNLQRFEPKLTKFPSGSMMIDLTINGTMYTIERDPNEKRFGLSKTKQATYGWEGYEQTLEDIVELEKRILEIERASRR